MRSQLTILTDENGKETYHGSLREACKVAGLKEQTVRNYMSKRGERRYETSYGKNNYKVEVITKANPRYLNAHAEYLKTK